MPGGVGRVCLFLLETKVLLGVTVSKCVFFYVPLPCKGLVDVH